MSFHTRTRTSSYIIPFLMCYYFDFSVDRILADRGNGSADLTGCLSVCLCVVAGLVFVVRIINTEDSCFVLNVGLHPPIKKRPPHSESLLIELAKAYMSVKATFEILRPYRIFGFHYATVGHLSSC